LRRSSIANVEVRQRAIGGWLLSQSGQRRDYANRGQHERRGSEAQSGRHHDPPGKQAKRC
jgi:hypothetical protein